MKLVMTLLARNEADIVDAQIAFHLHAGVDFVVAMDNRSDDGTTEILERYERAGCLRLLREDGDDIRQQEWVTRLARLAATEHAADWVINADADEFWWPRGGTLKEVLDLVPERFGVVRGCWRHFLPRPAGNLFFAERMTVRLCRPAFPGDKSTIYHAHQKVAHRADPEIEIERGNHNALGANTEPLRLWHPIEVLHFSFRSAEQLESKARTSWMRSPPSDQAEHQVRLDRAYREGGLGAFFESYAVSDPELERGLARGDLAIDTRLRDALRTIHESDSTFQLPNGRSALAFPPPSLAEQAAFAAEASALVGIDGIVRAERRVEALEERVAGLPTLPTR
jgi:hypothetical protein